MPQGAGTPEEFLEMRQIEINSSSLESFSHTPTHGAPGMRHKLSWEYDVRR